MTARKTAAKRLDLSLEPVPGQPYELHDVIVRRPSGHYQPTGGYVVRRDEHGVATDSGGAWWAGIAWLTDPEHGPYRSLASARKAVVTEQVLAPALIERGFDR